MVKGPASSIEKISFVQTHPLNITGAVSTIEKEVPLDLPEDLSLAGNGENARINARVVIEKQLVEKTFENIPVQMVNNIYPGIVQPNSVTITIRGSMLFLANEFSSDDIQVRVDLKGMGPGIHVLPVQIRLPEQTDLLRIDPQVFTVRILPQPSNTSGEKNASGS
jgi:YbbR domain-containing protein